MSALKDFLQTDADRILAQAREEEERYARWEQSVLALFDQVEGWVREADPRQLVRMVREDYHPFSPTSPRQSRLVFTLGTHRARLEAKGPSVIGKVADESADPPREFKPAGRAELVGGDHEYVLLLDRTDGADRWFIRTTVWRVRPLDRRTFEGLLAGLLA
jgi:hypothetical protein